MTRQKILTGYFDGELWHYWLGCGHSVVSDRAPWEFPRGWFCLRCFENVLEEIRRITPTGWGRPKLQQEA